MKIALITKRVSQSLGGAERVSVNLGAKLSECGHDVHIFTGFIEAPVQGIETHLVRTNKLLSPLRLLSFRKKVAELVAQERFDVVYSLCQVYPVDIYRVGDGLHRHWMKVRYPRALLRQLKYITSLVHFVMRYLEGRIFTNGNCRLFITNSKLVRDQIIEYFNISEEQIKVIYNGVDHGIFNSGVKIHRDVMRRKHGIGAKELVILFVSNNWERKGLSTVLKAISYAGIENIRLIVAGRGNIKRYISTMKKQKIGIETVVFIGRTAEVEKYYGMSDFFVLPSMYEPFANACLEAMACGLPCITTKTNGASEIITAGRDGLIMDEWNDSLALAGMLQQLNDESLLRTMGENASQTAESYTWERHLAETSECFRILTGGNSSTGIV